MAELREVFEMVTEQTEPDVDAWKQQEQRQRRTSRNRRLGALALAATIGVVAVVVVIRAMDDEPATQPGGQGTGATELPTDESIPPLPSGSVEPGRYVFSDATVQLTIEVPDGYSSVGSAAVLKDGFTQTSVSTLAISDVYAHPCRWQGGALVDPSKISSTDGVVAALASQQGLRVSARTDVTVDGHAATYLERRVPNGTDVSDCDLGEFHVYSSPDWGDRWLANGQLQRLWIVDVDGVPLVIDASVLPGTSSEVREELQQIVESIQIDPVEED
jgi:hypothetical protein